MTYFSGQSRGASWTNGRLRAMLIRLSIVALFLSICVLLVFVVFSPDAKRLQITSLFPEFFRRQRVVVEPQKQATIVKADVLVATEIVPTGTRLRPNMFKVELRPINGIEDQVIRDLSSIRNQYASTQLSADTVVLKEQLSTTSPINVITSRIPEGFRAVSIPVDAESGVEGWARPGAKVDVVWSTEHRGRKLVTTIVENAEVLSAERSTETDTATQMGQPLPSHITLLVSLRDAQRIHLAKASGALSLNLRGDTDNQSGTVETISMEKLLKPIVSQDIGEIQGKVTLNGEEFVFAEGKLIPVKDLKIEDEEKQGEAALEEKASWQPDVRARMKLEDEKK